MWWIEDNAEEWGMTDLFGRRKQKRAENNERDRNRRLGRASMRCTRI